MSMGLLSGVRILDLTWVLAGPYASLVLADLGAEVIKVESPERGDMTRDLGPSLGPLSAHFAALNRNKRSVALDLKSEAGRRVFYDLARHADALFTNYRPGVLERLKLDYEHLSAEAPSIVYCALSGYGATGPYRDKPAYDLVIQALSGGMSLTGEPGGPPVRSGIPFGDLAGGVFAALGLVSALVGRARTGRGAYLDVSLLDVQISLLSYIAAYYWANGEVPGPVGSGHPTIVPYGAYRARDGYLVLAIFGEKFWRDLCEALDLQALAADPRFATNADRVRHRGELEPLLRARLAERTTAEWIARCEQYGIPAAPVNSVDHALADLQACSRGMVREHVHPLLGRLRFLGNPIKTANGDDDGGRPAPLLGQDTAEVLTALLGMTRDEIERLEAAGVCRLA
ncbi:MAG: CoA transferase [Candidatus Rokubacteria bacterium]|nr:CoA transferase [Candidatus Rokubacteria bacterium]MBI2155940.1 CoA transferase [Candidatus Rokubacteria bacterium]